MDAVAGGPDERGEPGLLRRLGLARQRGPVMPCQDVAGVAATQAGYRIAPGLGMFGGMRWYARRCYLSLGISGPRRRPVPMASTPATTHPTPTRPMNVMAR